MTLTEGKYVIYFDKQINDYLSYKEMLSGIYSAGHIYKIISDNKILKYQVKIFDITDDKNIIEDIIETDIDHLIPAYNSLTVEQNIYYYWVYQLEKKLFNNYTSTNIVEYFNADILSYKNINEMSNAFHCSGYIQQRIDNERSEVRIYQINDKEQRDKVLIVNNNQLLKRDINFPAQTTIEEYWNNFIDKNNLKKIRNKDEKRSLALKKAQQKYNQKNSKIFNMKLNKNTDAELIEYLEGIPNKQKYLKSLVINDLQNKKQEN